MDMRRKHSAAGGDESLTKGRWFTSRLVAGLVFTLTLGWLAYVLLASLVD